MKRRYGSAFGFVFLLLFALILVGCADEGGDTYEDKEEDVVATSTLVGNQGDTSADAAGFAPASAISDFITAEMENNTIPGVAISIVRGEEIVWAQGFGVRNLDSGAAVTPETLFHIGSTQKSMTSMMIAALVDGGKVDWDTPVADIIPNFSLSDESVTIRQLLTMTSGIADTAEEEFDGDTPAHLLAFLQEYELDSEPGEAYSYSNLAISLAGYAAVYANNPPATDLYAGYDELLHQIVLDPLGMNGSTQSVSQARGTANFAVSHELDGGEMVVAESYDVDEDVLAPSGSLKSNVLDMGRYLATQLNMGVAPTGKRLVSAVNLQETWQPVTDVGDGTYAMGWEIATIDGITVIMHEGAYDGFTSLIGFIPDYSVAFVVLVNAEESEDLLTGLPELLVAVMGEEWE